MVYKISITYLYNLVKIYARYFASGIRRGLNINKIYL
jgi:hypothetical protein